VTTNLPVWSFMGKNYFWNEGSTLFDQIAWRACRVNTDCYKVNLVKHFDAQNSWSNTFRIFNRQASVLQLIPVAVRTEVILSL
jgi:hypothetical protein